MGANDRPKRKNAGLKLKSIVDDKEDDLDDGLEESSNDLTDLEEVESTVDKENKMVGESNTEITQNISDLDKSYISREFFDSFYEQYLKFRYTVNDKLENFKENENEKLNLKNKLALKTFYLTIIAFDEGERI